MTFKNIESIILFLENNKEELQISDKEIETLSEPSEEDFKYLKRVGVTIKSQKRQKVYRSFSEFGDFA